MPRRLLTLSLRVMHLQRWLLRHRYG